MKGIESECSCSGVKSESRPRSAKACAIRINRNGRSGCGSPARSGSSCSRYLGSVISPVPVWLGETVLLTNGLGIAPTANRLFAKSLRNTLRVLVIDVAPYEEKPSNLLVATCPRQARMAFVSLPWNPGLTGEQIPCVTYLFCWQ